MSAMDMLLLLVPSVVIVWLLLGGFDRDAGLKRAQVSRRRQLHYRARVDGAPVRRSGVDGLPPEPYTIETVGVVVPEHPFDPEAMVSAAGLAFEESNAMAARQQTPAHQAAGMSPAAQATAGTPLVEATPLRVEH